MAGRDPLIFHVTTPPAPAQTLWGWKLWCRRTLRVFSCKNNTSVPYKHSPSQCSISFCSIFKNVIFRGKGVVCLNKQSLNNPPVFCRYKVRLEGALPPCTPLCSPARVTSSALEPHTSAASMLGSACGFILHHSSTLWQGQCKCQPRAELRAFSFPINVACT